MVTIKLKRIGKKKYPFYNVIAIEQSSYIKGRYIDKLGYFDPIKNNNTFLEIDKIKKWIDKGAVLSKRMQSLIKKYKTNSTE